MRTKRLFFALLAFSMAGFVACDDVKYGDATYKPTDKDIAVTIKSPGAELTRAVIDEDAEGYSVLWEVGNSIGVFTSGDVANENRQFTIKDKGITDGIATFSGTLAAATTGSVSLYAYYPYDVNAADPKAVSMTMPSLQNMTRKSFDTAAGFMAGVAGSVTITGKTLDVADYKFKSLGAMINISAGIDVAFPPAEGVTSSEIVSKIILEAPSSKVLSGAFTVNLATGAPTYPTTASEGSNILELNVPAGTTIAKLDAWLVSLPFGIATTDELKVTIVAGVYTIEKTFTAEEFTFAAGAVEELYVSIDSECAVEIDPNAPVHPEAPDKTYILGSGTEFGDAGMVMRKNSATEFEIYTKLGTGTYGFSDNAAEGIKYTLINNQLYTGTTGIDVAKAGIYYIKVNYATYAVSVQEVTDVKWWRCWSAETINMEYAGNGKWKCDNAYTLLGSTNTDTRYRFMATVGGVSYIWGNNVANGADKPASPAPSYFHISIRAQGTINQWDYGFKFYAADMGSYVDFVLDMSPTADAYTHTVAPTPIAITPAPLSYPANGATATLTATGSQLFAWAAGSAATGTVNYQVVFYKEEAGTTEVSRKGTNLTATSLQISNTDLNTIASSAGIEPGATGDLYWAVMTRVGSQEARSEIRKITVSRIQGLSVIPTNVYISGTGSEYGDAIAGAKAMRSLGGGKFEIYCKMTASSTFRLTSGKTGTYTTYALSGGNIIESTAASTIATPAGGTSVYRITADFTTASLTTQIIGSVWFERGFARAADSKALDYIADGQWQYPSHTYADNDERYHFRVSYTIGGNPVADGGLWNEKWGNFVLDTQAQGQEWNINVMIGSANFGPEADWSYSFKLRSRNPGTGVLTLNMNAATPTHSIAW